MLCSPARAPPPWRQIRLSQGDAEPGDTGASRRAVTEAVEFAASAGEALTIARNRRGLGEAGDRSTRSRRTEDMRAPRKESTIRIAPTPSNC